MIWYPPQMVNPTTISFKSVIFSKEKRKTTKLSDKQKQAGRQLDDVLSNDLEMRCGSRFLSRDRKNQSKAILAKGAELNNP